jgi:sarcosine oxidase
MHITNRSNQLENSRETVIVIGVGSMGSAACFYLAQRGYSVIGIEQFDIPHEMGSHTGQSRIIRKAYFESPEYVPLLERAYENWQTFEKITGEQLSYPTGIVYFGDAESATMRAVNQSATVHNILINQPSLEEIKLQFPAFEMPENFKAIVEPNAGFVTPEKAIALYVKEAVKHGAVIKANEKVITWDKEGNDIKVTTNKGVYTCNKLIITAGAWASKVIPQLRAPLSVTRQILAWVNPKNWGAFSLGNFPCWFIDDPDRGVFYGFPILPKDQFEGPVGLKLAHHFPGEICDASTVNRSHIPAEAVENIRYLLDKYIPNAAGEILTAKSCLYTNSADEHFIIDHLPGYDQQVTIACGFSGHGFKFVSAIGEILADLATKGSTGLSIEFLRLSRFL